MSGAPDQLSEIYRKLKDDFRSHPVISVKPTKGDPPDHYEITYNINGLSKNKDGEVTESTKHTIELAIHFGFPHFPPNCKPTSDIFHPDFDPGAICLGDFWHQESSLTGLITHVGMMLNGEIYSTTSAFNEEAASWYIDNSNKLPLAAIDWGTDAEEAQILDDRGHDIDTLDDADLISDFNFRASGGPGPDEEITLEDSFPEIDETPEVDFDLLNLFESQKKYYQLLEATTGSAVSSEKIRGLAKIAEREIRKAKELHRQGKNFENQGNAKEALEKYQQVANTVADYPTIGSDVRRISQTLALLEDMAVDLFPDHVESSPPAVDEDAVSPDSVVSPASAKSNKMVLQANRNTFPKHKETGRKLPLYLLLALLVTAIGCGGYFWYSFNHKLKGADEAFSVCSAALVNNQFTAARRSCEKALQYAEGVKFIQQDRVQQLQNSVQKILQSEKLTQGLAGNILIDGKYLPKKEAEIIQSIKMSLKDVEPLYLEEKWQSALELYIKIQAMIEQTSHFGVQTVEDINHKRLTSELRLSYDSAQESMQNGQWQKAAAELIKARTILDSMPEKDRAIYDMQLQFAIKKCKFEDFKAQGDLSFSKSDWQNAISAYSLALSSTQDNTPLPPETVDTVRGNIKRAQLYIAINNGNEAFASGAWQKAIDSYHEASLFLTDNDGIFSRKDAEINQQKLARIVLTASVIRDRQIAKDLLEKLDLKGARKTYQQILKHIAKSSLATEKEFVDTRKEISSTVKSLDRKIFLSGKEEYLKNNYKALFIASYPASIPENLTPPLILFNRETDSKLIFRMQCTEKGRGRPLTLVMHYAYDKKTSRWNLYYENQ